ncbi:hypothetical protein Hanom_Chr15g01388261 [Helianthus anomalus]
MPSSTPLLKRERYLGSRDRISEFVLKIEYLTSLYEKAFKVCLPEMH